MTTAELYHALDGSGYEHDVCWRKTAAFHLRMPVAASSYRSPQCGIRDLIRRRLVDRIAHAPRVGMDRSVLFIRPARLQCRRCQRVLTGALPGMEPLQRHEECRNDCGGSSKDDDDPRWGTMDGRERRNDSQHRPAAAAEAIRKAARLRSESPCE